MRPTRPLFALALATFLAVTPNASAQDPNAKEALAARAADLPLNLLKLPQGFTIDLYAANLPGARSLTRGDKGTLFVGKRSSKEGVVYAVADTDADGLADKTWTVAQGLNTPNGVAFHKGNLYIAEEQRISRLDAIEDHLDNPPAPVVIVDNIPTGDGHQWKYLAIGPDEKLYFNMGAPCNICNEEPTEPRHATIQRCNLDGTGMETFARGVRNTVGITWHPTTQELWFTDNGRDMLGDNRPPCELNRAPQPGLHFGYPFWHGADIADPEFGTLKPLAEVTLPAHNLEAHVAPLGLRFYTGTQFPEPYRNQIFIAEHGSWNRSIPIGYRVMVATLDTNGNVLRYEPFIQGWLQRAKSWGRPVDLLVQPDGSLLVSDDQAGVIYRIRYTG